LTLSNALIQAGFVDEANSYINKSLDYDPQNYYSPMLKAYILFAKDGDIVQTQKLLMKEWNKDTTRLDILQEVAKFWYFQEKYDSAFYYYEKFVNARVRFGLDIYPQEDIKIAIVYHKKGLDTQAKEFFNTYAEYCEKDNSIYKSASMAVKYAYEGKNDKAIEQLKVFATQENYQYWILVFMEMDPLIKPLKNSPEFDKVMQKIESRFWDKQKKLKKLLEKKGLL
jgi:predicted Zn-dependent protease